MGIEHSEALTRKYKIDKLLVAAGWKIVPYKEGGSPRSYNKCAVTEYPTNSGPADYVLVLDEEPLAIVEAKKGAVGVYNVLEQAKRYARGTLFSCWENCLRLAPKPPCPSSSHSPCVGGVRHPPKQARVGSPPQNPLFTPSSPSFSGKKRLYREKGAGRLGRNYNINKDF